MQKEPLKPKKNLGIDLMGGETPPHELLSDLVPLLLQTDRAPYLTIFGTLQLQNHYDALLQKFPKLGSITTFMLSEEVISLDEPPLLAIRRKKNSSLSLSMKALQENSLDGMITCGNTGAMIAASLRYLPLLPGISRPALSVMMPTESGSMVVLDVGANVSSKKEHFLQYVELGVALKKAEKISHPKVGLLNIGAEAVKGTKALQEAYQELKAKENGFQFIGNIEGKEAFLGAVDVLVTDGFTGNIFLKTAEGIAHFVLSRVEKKISTPIENLFPDLQKHLHYAKFPGALLLGVQPLVIKCHSYAKGIAVFSAILAAQKMLEEKLTSQIEAYLTH